MPRLIRQGVCVCGVRWIVEADGKVCRDRYTLRLTLIQL